MKRADRMFQIVSFMQSRRMAVTAQRIADEFDISVRTVYRDVQDLIVSGVPISGEAGVGYLIDKSHCLPPMALEVGELETLMLGAAMVSTYTDAAMAKSARRLVGKIKNVLNEKDRATFAGTALFAPATDALIPWSVDFSALRAAIRSKQKLKLAYEDKDGEPTGRTVWPLAMTFWGSKWLLLAWCELRGDHRNFRLDRMASAEVLEEIFTETRETSLQHYLDCLGVKDGLHG